MARGDHKSKSDPSFWGWKKMGLSFCSLGCLEAQFWALHFRKAMTQLKRGQKTVAVKRKREKIVLHSCV